LIVFAWLYPRATRWLLDRYGVVGRPGTSRLHGDPEDPDPHDPGAVPAGTGSNAERVIDGRDLPTRHIYCLDLRAGDACQRLIDEVRRIADPAKYDPARRAAPAERVQFIDDPAPRRWFPVIDYSRCTNCMECIDFCLFGVYGIDARETILVEQPDNCRKGCPACSRVCPENAIMFPQHKAPAIAGAAGGHRRTEDRSLPAVRRPVRRGKRAPDRGPRTRGTTPPAPNRTGAATIPMTNWNN
jgi:NAD-dependent dihydropyrimidine dehydrogenase PreA subunit